jgi:hypothetical protein
MLVADWRLADFDALIRDGWPGVDPRRTVLLEHAPAVGLPLPGGERSGVRGLQTSELPGTARIIRYSNAEVTVETDTPAAALLVLNDVWHPWWRADIDGTPAEILKANVLFRAVQVPAGKHVVRFTFHPFAGALADLASKFKMRR